MSRSINIKSGEPRFNDHHGFKFAKRLFHKRNRRNPLPVQGMGKPFYTRPSKQVAAVIGSVGRNSSDQWMEAIIKARDLSGLDVVYTASVDCPNIVGGIKIQGRGNIFNRIPSSFAIACCFCMPAYGETTLAEICTAGASRVKVVYL